MYTEHAARSAGQEEGAMPAATLGNLQLRSLDAVESRRALVADATDAVYEHFRRAHAQGERNCPGWCRTWL